MQLFGLKDLLEGRKGIALGDEHNCPDIVPAVTAMLPELSRQHVKTLYIEMLPRDAAPLLADYIQGKASRFEVMETLTAHWDSFYENAHQNLMTLIDAAKAQGMEVVPLDVRVPMDERIKRANLKWQDIITREQADRPGKFAVFCGAMHLDSFNRYSREGDWDSYTGLDKLLDIPSVSFATLTTQRASAPPAIRQGNAGVPECDYVMMIPKERSVAMGAEAVLPQRF